MKKRNLLSLTAVFLLVSCNSEKPVEGSESALSEISASSMESSQLNEDSKNKQEQELNDIFLALESDLKPFVKGDKNGFKITPVGDNPLFKLSFKTDYDFSEASEQEQTDSSSIKKTFEPKDYNIELSCDEAKIETFNRTKKRGYSNRMTFENSDISVVREGTSLINLTQTYVGYLAQTEKAGTDPKEYENGLYLDLSKATLSRVTFAPLFNKLILPAKNYVNLDTVFSGIQALFPLSTTMNSLLPSAIDVLKEEVKTGALTLDKKTSNNVESYKIHQEIENKQSLIDKIDDIVDEALSSVGDLGFGRNDIDQILNDGLSKIQTLHGDFEINFNENEFENIIVDFHIKLDDIMSDEMNDLGVYFNLNEFIITSKISLLDSADVDYSTYPTNFQDHNVWKELELNL